MKLILALTLLLCLTGCAHGQILPNQVYVLAFEFFDCEATPQGDCDAGDLFILPNKRFALVDRCISGDIFYSGSYDLSKTQLTLRFNRRTINEIQDNDYNVLGYADKTTGLVHATFDIKYCNNRLQLVNKKDSTTWWYGSRYEPSKEKELATELLLSKPWKQLTK